MAFFYRTGSPPHPEQVRFFPVRLASPPAHGLGELFTQVGGHGQHVAPAAAIVEVETVLAAHAEDGALRVAEGSTLLALLLGDGLVGLVLPLVAQSFVEHQRQDVVLVVLAGGFATQDVGGAPEVGFELLLGQFHVGLEFRSLASSLSMACARACVRWSCQCGPASSRPRLRHRHMQGINLMQLGAEKPRMAGPRCAMHVASCTTVPLAQPSASQAVRRAGGRHESG